MVGETREISEIQSLVILAGVALVLSGAFAYVMFSGILFGTVPEPISVGSDDGFNTTQTLYPGDTASASLTAANGADSAYDLLVQIEDFNSTTGETGLGNARNKSNGYVENLSVAGDRYTFDLLNDGEADYHTFQSGARVDSAIDLSVPGAAAAGGNVSVTIGLDRGTAAAPSSLVKMHWDVNAAPTNATGQPCAACHGSETASGVHADKGATEDCRDCHGDTFQDAHMDCTSACHDGYPINGHGPDQDHSVRADYRCGGDCHGDQQELAHRYIMGGTCQVCHGETTDDDANGAPDNLMSMHGSFGERSCKTCHGLNSDGVHRPYDSDDCGACHPTIAGGSGFDGFDLGSMHENPDDCSSCHSSSNRKLVHDGTTRDCTTCHGSSTVTVGVMDHTSSESTCTDCHTNGGSIDLGSLHDNPGDCSQCHGTSDLQGIHDGTDLACDTCHSSSTVSADGREHDSGDSSCSRCHNGYR